MFKNCTKCRHAVIRASKFKPIQEGMKRINGELHVKCLAGQTNLMADYYKRNLNIPYGGHDEVFDCYTPNEKDEQYERLIKVSKKNLI